jgi:Ferredoxin-like domain in Api92-like protein
MPNWCHNSMNITGSIDDIARFKQTCIGVVFEGEQAQLDFNKITPMPVFSDQETSVDGPYRDRPAWYNWACEHWGTKWNATHFWVERDEDGHYDCGFDTAWSPPVPIWEKLGEMFPALNFSLSGVEPLVDFAFRGTIENGKLELLNVPTIWETVDPKTGETVSGTYEEVATVWGKGCGFVSTRAGEAPPKPEELTRGATRSRTR